MLDEKTVCESVSRREMSTETKRVTNVRFASGATQSPMRRSVTSSAQYKQALLKLRLRLLVRWLKLGRRFHLYAG